MAHGDRFIAPGKKLEDFSDASYEEYADMFSKCYEVEKLKNFRVFQAEKYLNDRTKAEAIRNDFIKYQRNRFKQLGQKGYGATNLVDCKTLSDLYERINSLHEEVVATGIDTSDNKEYSMSVKILNLVKSRAGLEDAFKKAESILEKVYLEFEDGENAIYNWKEQESDQVGMELVYRLKG